MYGVSHVHVLVRVSSAESFTPLIQSQKNRHSFIKAGKLTKFE